MRATVGLKTRRCQDSRDPDRLSCRARTRSLRSRYGDEVARWQNHRFRNMYSLDDLPTRQRIREIAWTASWRSPFASGASLPIARRLLKGSASALIAPIASGMAHPPIRLLLPVEAVTGHAVAPVFAPRLRHLEE